MDYLQFIIVFYFIRRLFNLIDNSIPNNRNRISFPEFFAYLLNSIPSIQISVSTDSNNEEEETNKDKEAVTDFNTQCSQTNIQSENFNVDTVCYTNGCCDVPQTIEEENNPLQNIEEDIQQLNFNNTNDVEDREDREETRIENQLDEMINKAFETLTNDINYTF